MKTSINLCSKRLWTVRSRTATRLWVGMSLLSGLWTAGAPAAADAPAFRTAAAFIRAGDAPGGVCSILGAGDIGLARGFVEQGAFIVHCLVPDRNLCGRLRRAADAAGVAGHVSVDIHSKGSALPYVHNLLNTAVVLPRAWSGDDRARLLSEVFRSLVPRGSVFLAVPSTAAATASGELRKAGFRDVSPLTTPDGASWLQGRKPWPDNIDEWGHYLHGPDGNAVARDTVVGPPRHYQWIADPLWLRSHETDSSIRTLVTTRGRLFYIENEAPISLAGDNGLPDEWVLKARDGFNGVFLWKVPMRRWGWREWKSSWFTPRPGDIPLNIQKRLVAVGDDLYVTLGYKAPVTRIDARTGTLGRTYPDTEPTGEILFSNGTLLVSVFREQGLKVMAVDPDTGKTLWTTKNAYSGSTVDYYRWRAMHGSIKPTKLDPTLNMATDGNTIALLDGPRVVGLDFRTGAEKWRTLFPQAEDDGRTGGIRTLGNLWVGALIVTDGVVINATPNRLGGLSAATGKVLWTQPKKFIGHLWYEWKEVFVIDGLAWTWSSELLLWQNGRNRSRYPVSVNGYDVRTGKLKKKVDLGPIFKTYHHHRCYRNKATLRYIISSRRGSEFIDLHGGKHSVNNWVRGTCHLGMMPANGLQYVPPHPCACYIQEKINGFNALAAALPGETLPEKLTPATAPEHGPAFGRASGPTAGPKDWPAFRHDAARTGASGTNVPDGLKTLWRRGLGDTLSPPVVVAGRVYVALVDQQSVLCVDARDGEEIWRFDAGGRVDSPPAYYKGTVIFGSRDGWVHCLRAADGAVVWRFRAAPAKRLIVAFGRLESAWPVHGSVLVHNGTVYFSAGRSSELDGGIFLYGLDAATGVVRYHTRLAGPYYDSSNIKENFRLPEGALSDILVADGPNLYMRNLAFAPDLKRAQGRPAVAVRDGFLDGTYFKRVPWIFDREYARLIVRDKSSAYYVRMFDSLRGLDPSVYFTPGRNGYLLFAKNMGDKKQAWMGRIPVRVRAMALANGRLLAAGPPDVVDPKDPLGAFEERKGGVLLVLAAATGKEAFRIALPAPPVFNGIAVSAGRVYLTDEAGAMICLGRP
ncbi:MAG: PQQ-binding-like beta-propeller repeat protein [Kiritimatiellaeota bacterium]|nr:PQQ-binding-like beta-propeller repeat protein [Kiritimatiellota bacterium]